MRCSVDEAAPKRVRTGSTGGRPGVGDDGVFCGHSLHREASAGYRAELGAESVRRGILKDVGGPCHVSPGVVQGRRRHAVRARLGLGHRWAFGRRQGLLGLLSLGPSLLEVRDERPVPHRVALLPSPRGCRDHRHFRRGLPWMERQRRRSIGRGRAALSLGPRRGPAHLARPREERCSCRRRPPAARSLPGGNNARRHEAGPGPRHASPMPVVHWGLQVPRGGSFLGMEGLLPLVAVPLCLGRCRSLWEKRRRRGRRNLHGGSIRAAVCGGWAGCLCSLEPGGRSLPRAGPPGWGAEEPSPTTGSPLAMQVPRMRLH